VAAAAVNVPVSVDRTSPLLLTERKRGAQPCLARVLRALGALNALLPAIVRAGSVKVLAVLSGSVLRIRREEVAARLAQTGLSMAPERMYIALSARIWELCRLWARPEALASTIAVDDAVLAALKNVQSTGVVVVTSHCGQFEGGAYLLAALRNTLALVSRPTFAPLARALTWLRAGFALGELGGDGALLRALGSLRAGAAVCVMIDQVPACKAAAVQGTFFNVPVWIDPTAFVLAQRARVGALHLALCTDSAGSQRVRLLGNWTVEAVQAAETRILAQAATRELEAHVRAHPADWLWLHRRFRAPKG
jgi:lauroyl/myristoyl acyltransferase